jgi:CDGSH-type Zn-finger protein
MTDMPAKAPFALPLDAAKTYFWCACGQSKKQPFCDGSHAGSAFSPLRFQPQASATAFLCGCKQTKSPPFCDGSHKAL